MSQKAQSNQEQLPGSGKRRGFLTVWTGPKHILVLITRHLGKWAPAGGPRGAVESV